MRPPRGYSDADGLVSGTTYYYVVRATDQGNGAEETNLVERSGAPTGPATIGSWLDDLEPTADAGWNHAAAQGTDWALSTTQSHSATHSWASVDVATVPTSGSSLRRRPLPPRRC